VSVFVFLIKHVGVSIDSFDKSGVWNNSGGGVLDLFLSDDWDSSVSVHWDSLSDLVVVGLASGFWDLLGGEEVEPVVDSRGLDLWDLVTVGVVLSSLNKLVNSVGLLLGGLDLSGLGVWHLLLFGVVFLDLDFLGGNV